MAWKLKKAKGADGDESEPGASPVNSPTIDPDDPSDFAIGIEPVEAATLAGDQIGSAAQTPLSNGNGEPKQTRAAGISDQDEWSLDAFAPYKPPQRQAGQTNSSGRDQPPTSPEVPVEEIDFTPTPPTAPVDASALPTLTSDDFELLPIGDAGSSAQPDWDLDVSAAQPRHLPLGDADDDDDDEDAVIAVPPPLGFDDDTFGEHVRQPVDFDGPVIAPPPASSAPEVIAPPAPALPLPSPAITPVPAPAPPATAPRRPRLTVQIGPFSAEYDLGDSDMVVGRPDPKTGAVPDIAVEWDDAISRRHLQIIHKDGRYWAQDLGSKNGSFLNDARLASEVPAVLSPGDVIRVGERTLIVFGQ